MANAEKILARMRTNSCDWRIEDLQVLARQFGIAWRRHGTSHVTFWHSTAGLLTVPAARPVKAVYIRRFVALADSLEDAR